MVAHARYPRDPAVLQTGIDRTAEWFWSHNSLSHNDVSARYELPAQPILPPTPRDVGPNEMPGIEGVTALAAGGAHSCALLFDGGAACWGAGENG